MARTGCRLTFNLVTSSQGLFYTSCFSAGLPPACPGAWGCLSAFVGLPELHDVLVSPAGLALVRTFFKREKKSSFLLKINRRKASGKRQKKLCHSVTGKKKTTECHVTPPCLPQISISERVNKSMLSAFVASLFISHFKDTSFLGIKLTVRDLPEHLSERERFCITKRQRFFPPLFPQVQCRKGDEILSISNN